MILDFEEYKKLEQQLDLDYGVPVSNRSDN